MAFDREKEKVVGPDGSDAACLSTLSLLLL